MDETAVLTDAFSPRDCLHACIGHACIGHIDGDAGDFLSSLIDRFEPLPDKLDLPESGGDFSLPGIRIAEYRETRYLKTRFEERDVVDASALSVPDRLERPSGAYGQTLHQHITKAFTSALPTHSEENDMSTANQTEVPSCTSHRNHHILSGH